MPRMKDGKFQLNMHQNGFLSRLKTLIEIQSTTKEINDVQIDISPVDICANSIIQLMKQSNTKTIYHISNPHLFTLKDILSSFGITLKEVDVHTCIDLIKALNQPLNAHLMNDLLSPEYEEVSFSSSITNQRLHELGFDWPQFNQSYLYNLYNLILQI